MVTKKHKSLGCLLLVTHHFIITIWNICAPIEKPSKVHVLKISCAFWTSIGGNYYHKKLPSISRTPFVMKIGQTQALFFLHKNEITKQNLNVKTIKQLKNLLASSSSLGYVKTFVFNNSFSNSMQKISQHLTMYFYVFFCLVWAHNILKITRK